MWTTIWDWWEIATKKFSDVKRLYWSTYDLHRNKRGLQRHSHAVRDTAKTLHKYAMMRAPRILHQTPTETTYVVPIVVNHDKYRFPFVVKKRGRIKRITGAWGTLENGSNTNITISIQSYAGPNEDWLINLSPTALGYNSIQINLLDPETFDIHQVVFTGEERIDLDGRPKESATGINKLHHN
jgi:hypothetical protein